jgi:hypothetical protein
MLLVLPAGLFVPWIFFAKLVILFCALRILSCCKWLFRHLISLQTFCVAPPHCVTKIFLILSLVLQYTYKRKENGDEMRLPAPTTGAKKTDTSCERRCRRIPTDVFVGPGYKQVNSWYGNLPGENGCLTSSRRGKAVTCTKKCTAFGPLEVERSIAIVLLHYTT